MCISTNQALRHCILWFFILLDFSIVFLGFGSSMDSMDSQVPRLALVPPQALPTGPTGPTGPLRGDQQSELPRSFASVNMFLIFVSV